MFRTRNLTTTVCNKICYIRSMGLSFIWLSKWINQTGLPRELFFQSGRRIIKIDDLSGPLHLVEKRLSSHRIVVRRLPTSRTLPILPLNAIASVRFLWTGYALAFHLRPRRSFSILRTAYQWKEWPVPLSSFLPKEVAFWPMTLNISLSAGTSNFCKTRWTSSLQSDLC